ncbi:alpha/beta fold hydrolase [Acuticoccus sp. MNP-M23]|uniref:alpha/beta fold hydrolase n=1 Tax=Acuticoccus sp. MNP-M23 TaxID=3072793 RepID=UPI002815725D|nr:alpha/beta fold hydrolase [Acuticoccus sp. MNP-M23]WMS44090.1 alpha/beta fold hydrolase [Acuticoccus sp. MNP-M23]
MDEIPAPLIPLPHTSRGDGDPPLVLIHGFGGDRLAWSGLAGPLSRQRRTLAFDLPGHGAAAAWSPVPNAAAAARALIDSLDALGITRAVLVGHSLGGAVASIVGLMRPDLVARLILLAPGGFGPEMNVALLRRYADAQDEAALAAVLPGFFAPDFAVPPALARLGAESRTAPGVADSLAAIVKVITKDEGQGTLPLADLAAQPFPVTLVWGDADGVLPVAQALAAPEAFVRHILPGAGHMPHLEAPKRVLEIITETLAADAATPAG